VAGTRVEGTYRFGPFQLDVRERRLSRGQEIIPLRLEVFETLRVLVANAGRLVTKQQLLDAVWPETPVEENNLNHNCRSRASPSIGPKRRHVDASANNQWLPFAIRTTICDRRCGDATRRRCGPTPQIDSRRT
jgi:hypothetical protein